MKTQNNSNIKHWDKGELYIHLRQINKNKQKIISNTLIPVQGRMWPEPLPAAQGTRQGPTLDWALFHHEPHTPPHTQTGTMLIHQFTSYAQFKDVGETQSPQRKPTQTWEGPYRQGPVTSIQTVALARNWLFFLLINILTKQHWTKCSSRTCHICFLDSLFLTWNYAFNIWNFREACLTEKTVVFRAWGWQDCAMGEDTPEGQSCLRTGPWFSTPEMSTFLIVLPFSPILKLLYLQQFP